MHEIEVNKLKKGMRHGVPIALGYLSVSFTFGLMAVSSGLNWWQAMLISMTNLTSAGQFAGLDIIISGGALVEMALSQLVINLRYALMSLSLSQKVDESIQRVHRFWVGFGITDEIFALAASQPKPVGRMYMLGLIIVPYAGWACGTLFGAVLGGILPGIVRDSLGIAIYGMFIAIIIPKARENANCLKVILFAVILSCCFRWIPVLNKISSGFAIIICAVAASAVGALLYPVREEEK